MYVRVASDEAEQPVELPCEGDSTLLLSTVQALFAGCIGLKYYNEGTQAFRGVRLADGHLYSPEGGWQSTVYIAVFPKERRRDDSEGSPITAKAGATSKTNVSGSGKQKCTDLIVLGLSYETNEEKLRCYFERFGPLALVQLKRDSKTQQSKGFAFIRFTQMDSQQRALNESHVIDDRACIVKVPDSQLNARESARCNKVFVGRITEQLTAEDLRNYFGNFGKVIDVYIPKPFRQFAFVTFAEAEVAQALWGEDHTIKGVEVHCGSATPKHTDKHKQPQQTTVVQQQTVATTPYSPSGLMPVTGAPFGTVNQYGAAPQNAGQFDRGAPHFDTRSYFHGAAPSGGTGTFQPNAGGSGPLPLNMYQSSTSGSVTPPRHGSAARFRNTASGAQPTYYTASSVPPVGAPPTSVAVAQWPNSVSTNTASSLGVSNASSSFGAQTLFGVHQAPPQAPMYAYMYSQQASQQRAVAAGTNQQQQATGARKESQTPTDMTMLRGAMQQLQIGAGGNDFGAAAGFQQIGATNGTRMPLGIAGKQPQPTGIAPRSGPGGHSPPVQTGAIDWTMTRSGGAAAGSGTPSNWWPGN